MTNYENDIQAITKNGAEGELTKVSINNGEIENVNTTTLLSEANELNPLAEPSATGQKNIISVDEASSIASGNNVYINQDNKLMQIDYDTLATAILNKLSTQSFDSLDTSSKLVLGAINELNGNMIRVESVVYNYGDYDTIYDAIKHYVDNLANDNTFHICYFIYGSGHMIFTQKYHANNYASAFVISYNLQRPIYLFKTDGSWNQILLNGTVI